MAPAFFQPELKRRYPEATYIGLDLAQGMIEYATGPAAGHGTWLVGDAESLPLASKQWTWYSAAWQYSGVTGRSCCSAELARVLKPGGRCVFTTLGPDTLRELRQAWAAVDYLSACEYFPPRGAALRLLTGCRELS